MLICETDRLIIRHFNLTDADYALKQLNDPSFIKFIFDKHVRTLDAAKNYLKNGPMASYEEFGFGLNMVLLKNSQTPIGMCGLVKRPELHLPDLGFAFLPEFWRQGYAMESCQSILKTASSTHHLERILSVTLPSNRSSNSLLLKLGFTHIGMKALYQENNNLYEYKN